MVAVTLDDRPALPQWSRGRAAAAGRPSPRTARPAGPIAAGRRARSTTAARRSAVVGLFAAAVAACTVWTQAGAGRAGSGPLAAPGAGRTVAVAARVWVVQPGDTIWRIARAVQPTGDIRPLVDTLSHEVHGAPLQVGEQLTLP